jgi:UDP:flavonoid glycosyltransferase YjiC (YdhE family)
VIHVTEATIHTHEPLLLKAAAQGLAGEPMQVVMTTGEHRSLDELKLGPLAPNIRIEAYVPHSELMRRTSVMVCLGGAGTVFAALKAGVPLVAASTGGQAQNAQRRRGRRGLRIEPCRLTAARLRPRQETPRTARFAERWRPRPPVAAMGRGRAARLPRGQSRTTAGSLVVSRGGERA